MPLKSLKVSHKVIRILTLYWDFKLQVCKTKGKRKKKRIQGNRSNAKPAINKEASSEKVETSRGNQIFSILEEFGLLRG